MPSPSLAEEVLLHCASLRDAVQQAADEGMRISASSFSALLMALGNIERAAERRKDYSDRERSRRATSATASVMAQGGPCD